MSAAALEHPHADSCWVRFWHEPVRAERLALMRILLAVALLADQLILYLPNLAEFYGPHGVAPAGLYDADNLAAWRVTSMFFSTDNMQVIYPTFALWMAVTVAFLLGWKTRWMAVALWLVTRCFHERHPNLSYGGDSVLRAALFLLMLAPCGTALSLDAWRKRRQGLLNGPAFVPPWSIRVLQIQLCLIYFSAGLAKLFGECDGGPMDAWWQMWAGIMKMFGSPQVQGPTGTWWDGTSLHFFLNDTTMSRWAYAEFPVPFWITRLMTYMTVWFEVFFPLLVLNRYTRRWALAYGIMLHIGIALTVDIGWFSYYTLTLYAVWIPDSLWRRFDKADKQKPGQPFQFTSSPLPTHS